MKAARIIEPMRVEVVDIERPEAKERQILVQNRASALCGSDMPFFLRQRPINYPLAPGFPGHECIGTVIQSRCREYKEGDEVLSIPTGDLGFAEHFVSIPERTVNLPDGDMRDNLVIGQPLGTVIHACRKFFHPLLRSHNDEKLPLDVGSWKLPDTKVAIVGQGAIGLLFTAMMKLMGADMVIAIDLIDHRLETAMKMGATHVINRSSSDPEKKVKEITGGSMADLVIEAVGENPTLDDCFNIVKKGGTVMAFGVPRRHSYDIQFHYFFWKEIKLLGSVGPEVQVDFPPAVDLIASDKIDVSPIISHRMALDDIQEAFVMSAMKTDNAIKILLEF